MSYKNTARSHVSLLAALVSHMRCHPLSAQSGLSSTKDSELIDLPEIRNNAKISTKQQV